MVYSRSQLRRLCLEGVISTMEYFEYRKMMSPQRNLKRKVIFNLDDIPIDECLCPFRFSHVEIMRLLEVFHIPRICVIKSRLKFSGVEGLCILLRRLAYPNRLGDLEKQFQRDHTSIARIFNWMLNFIYQRNGHILKRLNHAWLSEECLTDFADAISLTGSRYPNM